MAQYIDKDALVAEIERCINKCNDKKKSCPVNTQVEAICYNRISAFKEVISLINNIKVKEMDLEKEIDGELKTRWMGEYLNTEKFYESAKHFFELGLKAQKGK